MIRTDFVKYHPDLYIPKNHTMNSSWIIYAFIIIIYDKFVISEYGSNETCYDFSVSPENVFLEGSKYRLFSTKTTYLTAREEIRKIFPSEWPNEIEQCTPVYMFFLNRHSIRYPSAKEINKFNILLNTFREELLNSGKLSYRMFIYLATWRFRMSEVDDNHVSYTGKLETAQTGQYATIN